MHSAKQTRHHSLASSSDNLQNRTTDSFQTARQLSEFNEQGNNESSSLAKSVTSNTNDNLISKATDNVRPLTQKSSISKFPSTSVTSKSVLEEVNGEITIKNMGNLSEEEDRLFTAISFGKLHRIPTLLQNIKNTEVRSMLFFFSYSGKYEAMLVL